ncbi:GH39 family glycosyl hydrolase [Rudaea sp.]|uniref:GH39 family glycosyl hydrolase n=1 Tax=Rudaea sp. TaxID=2136325 RepID=UPI002ED1F5A9
MKNSTGASKLKLGLLSLALAAASPVLCAQTVEIDAAAKARAFPHFWEQSFGSGRAILALRDSYRQDIRAVKAATDFKYVRFHNIFHDEVGIYDEDAQGKAVYNWSYVDQIYDGLLADGVKPFVELSFMPKKLASGEFWHPFWYHPNISEPKDYAKWDAMIQAFARHLIERYGIDEVSTWLFEVWNEPNIGFWAGFPLQKTYWTLYDHTALALKGVDKRLRIGGPSTAQAAWVAEFIKHCKDKNIPFDFASTHVYGNDTADNVFGTNEEIPRDKMVCRAVKKVHEEIKKSAAPNTQLVWSEFNAAYDNTTQVTDSTYMGPWMASTIAQCDGLVDIMSYWSFSDVFEEQGVVKTPLYGGFGLIAADNLPKPAYNAFKVLHKLGDERIAVPSDSVLATRNKDGSLVLALWNYAPSGLDQAADKADKAKSAPVTLTLKLRNSKATSAQVSRVDREHGDLRPAYEKMGSPRYPTPVQQKELRKAAELPAPESIAIKDGTLTITLPPQGLAVVEIK